jgi:hypothetical protein
MLEESTTHAPCISTPYYGITWDYEELSAWGRESHYHIYAYDEPLEYIMHNDLFLILPQSPENDAKVQAVVDSLRGLVSQAS